MINMSKTFDIFSIQKGCMGMNTGLIFFAAFIITLVLVDAAMIVSLVRSGDERRKLVVWKASTYTLLGTAGSMVLEVIGSLMHRQEMAVNPFVKLCAMALTYFAFLLFFQKKHGG